MLYLFIENFERKKNFALCCFFVVFGELNKLSQPFYAYNAMWNVRILHDLCYLARSCKKYFLQDLFFLARFLQDSCKMMINLVRSCKIEVSLARILQDFCQVNASSCKILQVVLRDSCKTCFFCQLGAAQNVSANYNE